MEGRKIASNIMNKDKLARIARRWLEFQHPTQWPPAYRLFQSTTKVGEGVYGFPIEMCAIGTIYLIML